MAAEFGRAAEQAHASPFGLWVGAPSLDFAQAVAWKDGIVGRLNAGVATLLKQGRVRTVQGRGTMLDGKTCRVETDAGPQTIRAEHVLLATGSAPAALPALPFGGRVISSTEALSLPRVPERLAVVGAGYIGLELGMAFAKLGGDGHGGGGRRPHPAGLGCRADAPRPARDAAPGHRGADRHRGARPGGGGAALRVAAADGAERAIPAEGHPGGGRPRPCTTGFGLEGWTGDGRAVIRIDDGLRDLHAQCLGGRRCRGRADAGASRHGAGPDGGGDHAGRRRRFEPMAIPAICFTSPEVVSVGLSPAEARQAGQEIRVGQYPFSANGRALTEAAEEGFVRIVARADNHLVLGIQAVGAGVAELAAGFALALEMGARLEDIAGTITRIRPGARRSTTPRSGPSAKRSTRRENHMAVLQRKGLRQG